MHMRNDAFPIRFGSAGGYVDPPLQIISFLFAELSKYIIFAVLKK